MKVTLTREKKSFTKSKLNEYFAINSQFNSIFWKWAPKHRYVHCSTVLQDQFIDIVWICVPCEKRNTSPPLNERKRISRSTLNIEQVELDGVTSKIFSLEMLILYNIIVYSNTVNFVLWTFYYLDQMSLWYPFSLFVR